MISPSSARRLGTADAASPTPSEPRPDLPAAVGWTLVAIITLLVLASWSPSLTAALGDNHEGRILSRHALNVQNAQADGLAASGWLSDWSPYVGGPEGGQTSYAHHPPLMNLGYYLAGQVLPLRLDQAMRVFSYLLGVAMLPLGAALLRRCSLRWTAVLVATVAVAVTPLFWVYGRISGAATLLVAMAWMIVRLREDRPIGPVELGAAAAVCLAAVVAGYLGLATAALLGLALLAARGWDRTTVVIGTAMVVGAAITLAYVLGGTGLEGVGDQVQTRTQGGGFTAAEFVQRLSRWATALLPAWWRWLLLPVALVAGLWDRRTRTLTAILTVVALTYIVGLPNGSFIHDYWIFPVLLPVWVGTAAAGDLLERLLPARFEPLRSVRADQLLAGVGVVMLLAGTIGLARADVPATYLTGPEAAGALARTTTPPPGQTQAWRTGGVPAPRWLSLYWDLPPAEIDRDRLVEVGDDELVFVSLDRSPAWATADDIRTRAAAAEGGYAVITGAELRALAAD